MHVITRSHRYAQHKMRPVVAVVAWSVCLTVSRAKTAESIEMPIGLWTNEPCVTWEPGSPIGKWHFWAAILRHAET